MNDNNIDSDTYVVEMHDEDICIEDNYYSMNNDITNSELDSDDLFSGDNVDKNISNKLDISALSDSSVLHLFQDNRQPITPSAPVVPCTPLSLIPLLSTCNEQWNSDLETPQANKVKQNMNRSSNENNREKQLTPDISKVKNEDLEFPPSSPVIVTKRLRRKPKRRIFKQEILTQEIKSLSSPTEVNVIDNLEHVINEVNEISDIDSSSVSNTSQVTVILKSLKNIEDLNENKCNNISEKNNIVVENGSIQYSKNDMNELDQKNFFLQEMKILGNKSELSSNTNIETPKSLLIGELFMNNTNISDNVNTNSTNSKSEIPKEQLINPKFNLEMTREINVEKSAAHETFSQQLNKENINSDNNIIGFSTARGTYVPVSNEALSKAKKLLSSDLYPVNSNYSWLNNEQMTSSIKSNETINVGKHYEKFKSCDFFITASGQPITVTEEALTKAKASFGKELNISDLIVSSDNGVNEICTLEKQKSCQMNVISEEAPSKIEILNSKSDYVDHIIFKSNGEARQSISSANSIPSIKNKQKSNISETRNIKNEFKIETDNKNAGKPLNNQNEYKTVLCSFFSSASGQPITVSDNALSKAKNVFKEEIKFDDLNINHNVGFSTASNNKITVSNEALSKAKMFLLEESHNVDNTDFSLDGKQTLHIDSNSIEALCTIKDCLIPNYFHSSEMQNISNMNSNLNKQQVKIDDTPIDDSIICESSEKISEKLKSCNSFSTASGRFITISKEALYKAHIAFKEELTVPKQDEKFSDCKLINKLDENVETTISNATKDNKISMSSDAIVEVIKFHPCNINANNNDIENSNTASLIPPFQQENQMSHNIMSSFSTANGNALIVSEKALLHAKNLFENDSNIPESNLINQSKIDNASPEIGLNSNSIIRSLHECDSVKITQKDYSVKRKISDSDDGTPSRKYEVCNKKVRLSEEFAGKKLFSEQQNNNTNSKIINIEGVGSTGVFEDLDLEDIIASSEAFLDDEKNIENSTDWNTKEKHMSKSFNAVTHKDVANKMQGGKSVNESRRKTVHSCAELNVNLINSHFQQLRLIAISKQEEEIFMKQNHKPKPFIGRLLSYRICNKNCRCNLWDITGGSAPKPYTVDELIERGISKEILEMSSKTAVKYRFRCSDFYGRDYIEKNVNGLEMEDGSTLIPCKDNCIGLPEVKRGFLASQGIDPHLVPNGWVENHYKWIVWKLACIDKMKFGKANMPRALTINRVMEQLKYRYNREIDKVERPALRKILEKDDSASKRIVLCVSSIEGYEEFDNSIKTSGIPSVNKLELTDGWYSIDASVDSAMTNYIASGKIKIGTKLLIFGAELQNCDEGCSPLQVPCNVLLKIHSNSCRRVRWDQKLGYSQNPGPIPIRLHTVLPNGGLIGKITVIVARVYPILYHEKTSTGESVFRSARLEEKASLQYEEECRSKMESVYNTSQMRYSSGIKKGMNDFDSLEILAAQWSDNCEELYNKEFNSKDQKEKLLQRYQLKQQEFKEKIESELRKSLPAPRQVTPVLKIRVIDGNANAILTVWSPSEDITNILKEGYCITIRNLTASGKRSNELQLTAGRNTLFSRTVGDVFYPERSCSLLSDIAEYSFNPSYNEFDTVGVVSFIVDAPSGWKNFQAIVLAAPHREISSRSTYLSILFWQGSASYGYSEILTVGSLIACTNLEWRRMTSWNIPAAYCTERTTFSRHPKQCHLQEVFKDIKNRVKDFDVYSAQCAIEINAEIQKKSKNLLHSTPDKSISHKEDEVDDSEKFYSNELQKTSIQSRIEKLQNYGEPPDLSPIPFGVSKRARLEFKPIKHDSQTYNK